MDSWLILNHMQINLDSDEEKKPASPQPTDFEDENPEVDISLSW